MLQQFVKNLVCFTLWIQHVRLSNNNSYSGRCRERDVCQCSTKNHITQQISWFWLRAGVSVCKNWLFWLLKALHDTDYMLFLLITLVKWLLSTSGETTKTFCITFNLHYLDTSHFLLYFTMCSVRIHNFSNSFRIAISFT